MAENGSQIEKLRQKARLIGIDVDLLIGEIATVVGQQVQVNARELAEEIAASMPKVDVAEIVAQLRESIPETGGVALDVVEIKTSLKQEIWEDMEAKFEQVAGTLKEKLEQIRSDNQSGLDAAIDAKLMQYKDQMVAAVKQAGAQAAAVTGGDGQVAPNDRFGQAMMIIERIMDKQDPLANIEALSQTYARLGQIFGGGPDPTQLYRGNQQAFLEGLKVGARAKGGSAPASPLSQKPPGGLSTQRPRPSSRIDRVIEGL